MENEGSQHDHNDHQLPLADTQYARTARALNDVVNALRQSGANNTLDLPLPMIAVIGNQSVGKSSLIEAISQIRVPRSVGTCTRCPMEVRLRTGVPDTWTCKILVQSKDATSDGFFNITSNREDVEAILRRAQLAVLNPNKDLEFFSELSDEECENYEYVLGNEKPKDDTQEDEESLVKLKEWHKYECEKPFSEYSVVVEITGAPVDVTFIDLPGLIKVDEVYLLYLLFELTVIDNNMTGFVKNLVVSHVRKNECLILVVIQMGGIYQFLITALTPRRYRQPRGRHNCKGT